MSLRSRMPSRRAAGSDRLFRVFALSAAAFALATSSLPQAARATILDLTVTGVVTEVTTMVSGVFALNDPMTAVYTYDSAAAAIPSLIPTQATYLGAISAASFSIGSYSGTAAVGNVNIADDDPSFHDLMSFRAGGLSAASIGTHVPVSLTALLNDLTDAALGSLDLPTATSDLAGFTDRTWQLLFTPIPLAGDPVAAVGGRITSITISLNPVQIPEPGLLALFGLGLAGLGLARRRNGWRA